MRPKYDLHNIISTHLQVKWFFKRGCLNACLKILINDSTSKKIPGQLVRASHYQLEICDVKVPCFDVLLDDDAVVVAFSIVDSRPDVGFCCLESTGGGGRFRWKSSIILSMALLSPETSSSRSTLFLSRFDVDRWISETSLMTSFDSSCDWEVLKAEIISKIQLF